MQLASKSKLNKSSKWTQNLSGKQRCQWRHKRHHLFAQKQSKTESEGILDKLSILGQKDTVLIDARDDNKPPASKA
jgi:hypothetical protein